MKKIGITGTIGSGKSFVGTLLRERGFAVLDADLKVHELYRDSAELREELTEAFGADVLTSNGVDRVVLANRIFSDREAQKRLESIVYPHLNRAVEAFFADGDCGESRFLEAALLARVPETVALLDEIWIVDAPEDLRLTRLQARGLSYEDAKRRIENQRGDCDISLFADKRIHCINNGSDKPSLWSCVENLLFK